MFYPSSKSEKLDLSLFKNPPSEYRAAPFWAWNCDLKTELLEKEIEYMKEMGFGGFHMHPRVGLATPYLSDDFMSLVKTCVNKAKAEQMRAYLYDEDKWPSGFAGGLNTKDNICHWRRFQHAADDRFLVFLAPVCFRIVCCKFDKKQVRAVFQHILIKTE